MGVEISRTSKKDLVDLSEKMLGLMPNKDLKKEKAKADSQDLMDRIMGTGEDSVRDNLEEEKTGVRDRIKEDVLDDDGFEEWRQAILRRAVDQGFVKYKKYLVSL